MASETKFLRLPASAFLADHMLENPGYYTACQTEVEPGRWVVARPLPFRSFSNRLRLAWDVLRYRADALYWMADAD